METIQIEAIIYDEEPLELTLHICKEFDKVRTFLNSEKGSIINVWIIDRSVLETETFIIDGDVCSINPADFADYLENNSKYIFIDNGNATAVLIEHNETNLVDLLYWLSGGTKFYISTYLGKPTSTTFFY